MTDGTPPDGGTANVDANAAKRIAELEARLAAETAERTKLEGIRSDMEASRQAAKEREKKAQEEQGQYKALSESLQEENKTLKAEIESLKAKDSEVAGYKSKAAMWDAYEADTRKELLEQIPDDEREAYKDAPLSLLKSTVKLIGSQASGEHKGGAARAKGNGNKPWSEMTPEERDEYTRVHINDPETRRKKIAGKI